MNYTDIGGLTVNTYLARDALPVEGVRIRIRGMDEENADVEYSVLTDGDGRTETIALPAPDRRYSESPRPPEKPFATYRIEAEKDGYFSKVVDGVAVFGGTVTVLPINMIVSREGEPAPKDTLLTDSYENPQLQ